MADKSKYFVKNLKEFISTYRSTSGTYTDKINTAVQSVTDYTTLNSAITAFQNDLSDNYLLNSLTGMDFLKEKCNIVLLNTDNGSAIGSDAGSGVPRSRLDSFYYCTQHGVEIPSETSEVIDGITFNYVTTGLNSDHYYILGQMSSRWLACSIDLARRTFGFKSYEVGFFNSVDVEFLNRGISLSSDIRDQEVVSAQITYDSSGTATGAKIILNREYLNSTNIQDDFYGTYVVNSEMTVVSAVAKAVAKIMLAMYIQYFYSWKDFMQDGMTDSVVGIDEEYDDVFSTYYDNFNYVVWGFDNLSDLTISGSDATAQKLMTHTNGVSFLRYLFYNPEGYDALVQATDYGQTVNGTRYKTGVVYKYKDIFSEFIKFAVGEPDDLVKWDLVDDRLNGFYGATIRCPMPEAVVPLTNQNKLDPGYVKQILMLVTDEFNCDLDSESGKPNRLVNAVEERFGVNVEVLAPISFKFSEMFDIYNTYLDGMINDMEMTSDTELYSTDIYAFVFSGLERDLYEGTKPIAELLEDVITLTKKCVKLGINPVLIINPTLYSYVDMSPDTTEFIQDVDILIQHPWDIEESEGLKVVDGYSVMRSFLGVKDFSWNDCSDYICETGNHFNYTYNKRIATLIDNAIGNLGSKYLEPCFYISLCYHNITSSSYTDFKNHKSCYMTGTTKNWNIITNGDTRYVRTPKGVVNLFKNTGEICQIMLHTTFDTNLWACEQGGCTCKHFADYPVDDEIGFCKTYSSIQTQVRSNGKKYHQATWRNVGKPTCRWESNPVFPGTGTPWFCISTENKSEFDTETVGYRYYFTRTDYTATITIRIAGTETLDDVWQSMSFGCMDTPHLDQYRFPLYVAGGSQAVSPKVNYYQRQDATDSYDTNLGLMYDLNILNIMWMNSTLLTPCEANKNGYSNFRVLSPEGVWKSICAMNQSYSAYTVRDCAPPNHVQSYEIQLSATDIGQYTDRFGGDFTYYISKYADARPTVMDMALDRHSAIGIGFYRQLSGRYDDTDEWINLLFSIMPYLNQDLDYGESGVLGVISDTFGIYDKKLEEGVYKVNNKHYLIVPDVWLNRLVGYKQYWPYIGLDKSAYDYNYFYERYYIVPRIDTFHGKVAIRLD